MSRSNLELDTKPKCTKKVVMERTAIPAFAAYLCNCKPMSGGCCQWVLDTVCQTGERLISPAVRLRRPPYAAHESKLDIGLP